MDGFPLYFVMSFVNVVFASGEMVHCYDLNALSTDSTCTACGHRLTEDELRFLVGLREDIYA